MTHTLVPPGRDHREWPRPHPQGARAVVDQGAVVVLVGYRDPTPAECAAVERAPVGLALLTGEALS